MVNKLTEKQKEVLREIVEFKCQRCNKHEDEVGKLEVHRINRGLNGGNYFPSNILMLDSKCHRIFHNNEFQQVQSK